MQDLRATRVKVAFEPSERKGDRVESDVFCVKEYEMRNIARNQVVPRYDALCGYTGLFIFLWQLTLGINTSKNIIYLLLVTHRQFLCRSLIYLMLKTYGFLPKDCILLVFPFSSLDVCKYASRLKTKNSAPNSPATCGLDFWHRRERRLRRPLCAYDCIIFIRKDYIK